MRATLSALLRQRHVDEPPIFYLEESAQWAALALALEAPPAGLFCSPGPSVAAAGDDSRLRATGPTDPRPRAQTPAVAVSAGSRRGSAA